MHIGIVTKTDNDTAINLADNLTNSGFEVTLYFNHDAFIRRNIDQAQFINDLYDRGVISTACHINLYALPRMRDPRSFFAIRKMAEDMHRDRIDLLHILMGPAEPWLAMLANLLHDIPVVSTIIVPKANFGDPLRKWVAPVNKLLAHGTDLIILNCQNQVQDFRQRYHISRERIIHIPLDARTSALKWQAGHIQEQPGTVLFFGRSDPHKGLEYLIRAQPMISSRVPNLRIIIASRGEEMTRCLSLIQDEVYFEIHEGYIEADEMSNLFSRASLVVLPYLSASTSGVLLTAYEFRKPVVSTNVGCLPEYVQDGVTGLLIPAGEVEQLADAINRLLLDDALRHKMGENARKWVEEENRKSASLTIDAYGKAISIYRSRKLK